MKPKPAHIKAKEYAFEAQHKALQAPSYRLTLTARRDNLQTYNHGKGKGPEGTEKFYTADEVKDLIPQLSRQNARGYDIYVTPISSEHHYIVLDDSNVERLKDLQERTGIKPCYIQESSPDNLQAIIKADKIEGSQEQSNANYIVQSLNLSHGDPKFSGVVHPFRLAGFNNAKPKHEIDGQRPIVRPRPSVVETSQSSDHKLNEILQRQRVKQAEEQRQKVEQQRQRQYHQRQEEIANLNPRRSGSITACERYLLEAKKAVAFVQSKGWPIDYSRIDYHISKQMLKDDYFSQEQISSAITKCSPRICERHSNAESYATQTVSKASQDPEVQSRLEIEYETRNPQFR